MWTDGVHCTPPPPTPHPTPPHPHTPTPHTPTPHTHTQPCFPPLLLKFKTTISWSFWFFLLMCVKSKPEEKWNWKRERKTGRVNKKRALELALTHWGSQVVCGCHFWERLNLSSVNRRSCPNRGPLKKGGPFSSKWRHRGVERWGRLRVCALNQGCAADFCLARRISGG